MSSSPDKSELKRRLKVSFNCNKERQREIEALKQELGRIKLDLTKEHSARKQAEKDRDAERAERRRWKAFAEKKGWKSGSASAGKSSPAANMLPSALARSALDPQLRSAASNRTDQNATTSGATPRTNVYSEDASTSKASPQATTTYSRNSRALDYDSGSTTESSQSSLKCIQVDAEALALAKQDAKTSQRKSMVPHPRSRQNQREILVESSQGVDSRFTGQNKLLDKLKHKSTRDSGIGVDASLTPFSPNASRLDVLVPDKDNNHLRVSLNFDDTADVSMSSEQASLTASSHSLVDTHQRSPIRASPSQSPRKSKFAKDFGKESSRATPDSNANADADAYSELVARRSKFSQIFDFNDFAPPPTPPVDWKQLDAEAEKQRQLAPVLNKRKYQAEPPLFEPSNKRSRAQRDLAAEPTKGETSAVPLNTFDDDTESEEYPGQNFLRKIRDKRNAEIKANPEKYKRRPVKDEGKTINERYAIDPVKNRGERRAYYEGARKKSDRKQMHGRDCECCKGYWEKAVGLAGRMEAHGEDALNDIERARLNDRRNATSRHRDYWEPVPTPPDYWQMGFPDTQRVNLINEEARNMYDRKVERIERDINYGEGRYTKRK